MARVRRSKPVEKKEAAKRTPRKPEPVDDTPKIVNADIGSHLPDNYAGGIPNPQVVGNE